jgi:hypothetical protein
VVVREKAKTSVSPFTAGKFDLIDVYLVVALGLLTLAVHDVPYLLRHPFWVDEAWVADTVRARIGLTPSLASSTPVGWALLLRLVPFGGAQRLRLVPLAFTMLGAGAGYLFGRELRLTRFTTGILTGAAVLLSPAMLVRDDLKQYTAEAFAYLVLWVLVARIENEWHVRRLVAIAATTCIGLFLANTVIFAGVAAMGSLALECVVKRNYRRLLELAGASAGMLAVSLTIYEVVDRQQIAHNLVSYWARYYVPTRNPSAAISFIYLQLRQLAPYMGFRWLALDVTLALAGIAALLWLKRLALAVMFPMTLAIVIVASAARRYPFGDLRTSTFWLVAVPVLMAVAVAAAGRWAAAIDRRGPLIAAALALAVWVAATATYIRSHEIPNEDVRSEVVYVSAHFRPGDVIIVSYAASYAFAYYYQANPSFPADPAGPDGHIPAYPGVRSIVVMNNRRAADVANALAAATARVAVAPSGARGRIWIIRSHDTATEDQAWHRDLAGARVTVIHVGHDPLLLYVPS